MEHPEISDPSLVSFGLGRLRMRKDGFVSFDAGPHREGLLVTRPLLSEGGALEINGRCHAGGYIKVEVVDQGDELLPGRSREECDVFTGDATAHRVTWRGDATVPAARPEFGGDTVFPWKTKKPFRKIRFFMKNAELYSLRFVRTDADAETGSRALSGYLVLAAWFPMESSSAPPRARRLSASASKSPPARWSTLPAAWASTSSHSTRSTRP
tara:strand:- start:121 stop:756 length:636 start_codon:yes stop_codon:yes gene_type:complete